MTSIVWEHRKGELLAAYSNPHSPQQAGPSSARLVTMGKNRVNDVESNPLLGMQSGCATGYVPARSRLIVD